MLFGLVQERDLLPDLALEPADEVVGELRAVIDAGLAEANAGVPPELYEAAQSLLPALDFTAPSDDVLRQVHGGVDGAGLASPYASMVLRRPNEADTLRLAGRALGDGALRGAQVTVWVDEHEVGVVTLEPDGAFERTFPLPASVAERGFLGVRLSADDFVYRGTELRHCVAYRLSRVSLER